MGRRSRSVLGGSVLAGAVAATTTVLLRRRARPRWPAAEAVGRNASDPSAVLSPGGHVAPAGVKPGWDWFPGSGGRMRADLAPLWVRIWLHLPVIDRWAHVWMWRHGAIEIAGPGPDDDPGGESGGVREPRRPRPTGAGGRSELPTEVADDLRSGMPAELPAGPDPVNSR